jgi:N-dimethylarginine dimethylaminohydrolase
MGLLSDEGLVAKADVGEKKRRKKGETVMKEHIKNVVLVHGAFADGSGWEPVAKILTNDGYKVSVVQHPETQCHLLKNISR